MEKELEWVKRGYLHLPVGEEMRIALGGSILHNIIWQKRTIRGVFRSEMSGVGNVPSLRSIQAEKTQSPLSQMVQGHFYIL